MTTLAHQAAEHELRELLTTVLVEEARAVRGAEPIEGAIATRQAHRVALIVGGQAEAVLAAHYETEPPDVEPVPIVLHFDGDSEWTWIEHDHVDLDSCAESDSSFGVWVPAHLLAAVRDAEKALGAARTRLFEKVGWSDDLGGLAEHCEGWVGSVAEPGPPRWEIHYPPSGSEHVWPAGGRPVRVGYSFPSPEAAQAAIDSLPEEFFFTYQGEIPGHTIHRDRLFVDGPHQWAGHESRCFRCGHGRTEHEAEAA